MFARLTRYSTSIISAATRASSLTQRQIFRSPFCSVAASVSGDRGALCDQPSCHHQHHEHKKPDRTQTLRQIKPLNVPPCWSCGAAAFAPIFCKGCTAVQPPGISDHFGVFDLPRTFDLDRSVLEQKFRNLQRKLHPDIVSRRPDKESRFGVAQSTAINTAYDVLKDPLARALYLMELEGDTIDESTHINDPEFLEEQFEMRAALAEGGEAAQQVIAQAASRVEAAVREMSDAFRAGERDRMRRAAVRLCYASRLDRIVRGVDDHR